MTFELFVLAIIFAHFVGDYVLKSEYLSATKGKEWYNMLAHCILYTGSVGWVLINWTNSIPYFGLAFLLISHWLIDSWKCRMNSIAVSESDGKANLYMDQLFHFVVLAGLMGWYK